MLKSFSSIRKARQTARFAKREESAYFKEGRFRNTHDFAGKPWRKVLKMRFNSRWATWPKWVDIKAQEKPVVRVCDSKTRITFINHATLLIQVGGLNMLTDPVYAKRCSPFSFLGPKRVHKPGVAFDDLPPIDVVLISHDHYDHLDVATIDRLVKRDNPLLLMGLGVGARLPHLEDVVELDWWQHHTFRGLRATFVEVQHFSGRTLNDRNATLWGGFVLQIGNKQIYFAGDSGYGDYLVRTYERFGPMDIAILPIGAYAPRWLMQNVHMNPEEAVQAHLDLHAAKSIGMHFGTFQLTAEPIDEPEERLKAAVKAAGLKEDAFITQPLGLACVY